MWIAISLSTLIPLLAFLFYFSSQWVTFWTILSLPLVVFAGWAIVFKVITAIRRLTRHSTHALASIGVTAPSIIDEMQGLEAAINLLTDKVKTGFTQLKEYTEKSEKLNQEVSRKVIILSALLQANDLFAKDTPAEEIVKFLTHHLKQLLGLELCFCALRIGPGQALKLLSCLSADPERIERFIREKGSDLLHIRKTIVLDADNRHDFYASLSQELQTNNVALTPIALKANVVGMVGIGNNLKDFRFSKDDFDVLSLFSHILTLIWEHEQLSSKIQSLEVVDYLTGLYNQRMFIERLDEEIRRAIAYQRPCGFISLTISNYEHYQKTSGLIEAEKILKEVSTIFKESLKSIDIAGRIGPNALGAILIETNKRQSKKIAEELRQKLVKMFGGKLEFCFSVAESPVDGTSSGQLMDFAAASGSV